MNNPNTDELFAAIDLGSNSFHLIIAQLVRNEYQIIKKFSEKIGLANGLNANFELDLPTQKRAIECLERFAKHLNNIPNSAIRIVGTNTFRIARHIDPFLKEIKQTTGCTVDILAGREEARLIYQGASHALSHHDDNRLIIDIGGGSTELIIGYDYEPIIMESLHIGCITYSNIFFNDRKISETAFNQAVNLAERELLPLERAFKKLGWEEASGCSGTITSVFLIKEAMKGNSDTITLSDLKSLKKEVLKFKTLDEVKLPGLGQDRQAIFPAGLAILTALFKRLGIDNMTTSTGALREGVLYDMLEKRNHEDIRLRTTRQLMHQYQIDLEQSDKVTRACVLLFNLTGENWNLGSVHRDLLTRAALLHELGLSIAHNQFHKHGAYIVTNADLPGFSKDEQRALGFLIRAHRRKYPKAELNLLNSHNFESTRKLSILLRLAVIFERNYTEEIPADIQLNGNLSSLELTLSKKWIQEHPLTAEALEQEVDYLEAVKIKLKILEK